MNHKDLEAWKTAMDLVQAIYEISRDFPAHEQYGLTSQIRPSAISIPSNIAEGAARNSDKDFVRFLYVSLGSLAEMETQLIIAGRLTYVLHDTAH